MLMSNNNFNRFSNSENHIQSKKNDNYYNCFFENINIPMLIINPETTEIVDANESACSFYQYRYEDILKLKIIDINILSPEQVRYEIKLAKSQNRKKFYFKHRLSNGQIRDVEVLSNSIEIDGKQLLWSLIYDKSLLNTEEIKMDVPISKENAIVVSTAEKEINKRILTEKDLKESETRFRSLFDNMQLGFSLNEVITDDNGQPIDFKILLVNKIYKKITNKSYDDVVGRTILEIDPVADKEIIRKCCMTGLTGVPTQFEYFSNIFNKYLRVNVFSTKIGQFATVFEDITEMKMMEKEIIKAKELAEKASITKSEFITNMSHELRTPINVIFGAIQLFEFYMRNDTDVNNENYEAHLSSMKVNCLRLLKIVNNLIDTTKIDSGLYEPKLNNYDIIGIIEKIVLSVSNYVKQKNINFIFDTEVEEMIMMCDIDMIERIMLNIISNAIKFTNNYIGVNILIRDNTLIITVKDNGKGIKKDSENIIFERYKKAAELFTRENEGSGIGLFLTKSLIEMHGGNIYVKSDYGKGAEFIIELPIKASISEEDKVNDINYVSNEGIIEKMRVEFSDIYK